MTRRKLPNLTGPSRPLLTLPSTLALALSVVVSGCLPATVYTGFQPKAAKSAGDSATSDETPTGEATPSPTPTPTLSVAANVSARLIGTKSASGQVIRAQASGTTFVVTPFTSATFESGSTSLSNAGSATSDVAIQKFASDGTLSWTRVLTGTGDETVSYFEVASNGDLVLAGTFNSAAELKSSAGASLATLTHAGDVDLYVLRLTDAGAKVYANVIGSAAAEDLKRFLVASDGTAHVFGHIRGATTIRDSAGTSLAGVYFKGGIDYFVAKFAADGAFTYARTFGGTHNNDLGLEIALDSHLNLAVWGHTYNQGITSRILDQTGVSLAVFSPGSNQYREAIITSLSPAGAINWVRRVSGSGEDFAQKMVIDSQDRVIIAGERTSGNTVLMDQDGGAGTIFTFPPSAGSYDAYVIALDSAGAFLWSMSVGGPGAEFGYGSTGIALDSSDHVYVGGTFTSTSVTIVGKVGNAAAATLGSLTNADGGAATIDGFMLKVAPTGALDYAIRFGSTAADGKASLQVNGAGQVFLSNLYTAAVSVSDLSGTTLGSLPVRGATDVYVAKLESDGTLGYLRGIGGASTTVAVARPLLLESNGRPLLMGDFSGGDLEIWNTANTTIDSRTGAGNKDAFFGRLGTTGATDFLQTVAGTQDDTIAACSIRASDDYVISSYSLSPSLVFDGTTLPGTATGQWNVLGVQ